MFTPQEIKLLQYFIVKEPDIEKQHRGRRRNESGTSGRGFTELQAPISSSAKARVRDDFGMWAGVRDDSTKSHLMSAQLGWNQTSGEFLNFFIPRKFGKFRNRPQSSQPQAKKTPVSHARLSWSRMSPLPNAKTLEVDSQSANGGGMALHASACAVLARRIHRIVHRGRLLGDVTVPATGVFALGGRPIQARPTSSTADQIRSASLRSNSENHTTGHSRRNTW